MMVGISRTDAMMGKDCPFGHQQNEVRLRKPMRKSKGNALSQEGSAIAIVYAAKQRSVPLTKKMKDSENSDVQNGQSRVIAILIKSILKVYEKPPAEKTNVQFLCPSLEREKFRDSHPSLNFIEKGRVKFVCTYVW